MQKINLDNVKTIKSYDSKNMLGSLELLAKQAEQIKNVVDKIKFPTNFGSAKNLVVLGMGGSALGTHVVKSLFFNQLKIPVEIVGGYEVPNYVNKDSLVLASSYSGSTEEVLNSVKKAKECGAKIFVMCTGGELANWASIYNIPVLHFSTEHNPSNQPRMGLGYSIMGQILAFSKIGLFKLSRSQFFGMITAIAKYNSAFGVNNNLKNNLAKQLAVQALNRSVWYIAAEHLAGNAHISANQMNENAKRFAGYFIIPELNHHLMEGMIFPKSNQKEIIFALLESTTYNARIRKRFEITKKILKKNKIKYFVYSCQEKSQLLQACEVLVFGSYVSFYSAMLAGTDPTAIPFVDFFKEELKK